MCAEYKLAFDSPLHHHGGGESRDSKEDSAGAIIIVDDLDRRLKEKVYGGALGNAPLAGTSTSSYLHIMGRNKTRAFNESGEDLERTTRSAMNGTSSSEQDDAFLRGNECLHRLPNFAVLQPRTTTLFAVNSRSWPRMNSVVSLNKPRGWSLFALSHL